MNREKLIHVANGWAMLAVNIAIFLVSVAVFVAFIFSCIEAEQSGAIPNFYLLVASLLVMGLGIFMCCGHFTLQPNEGRVLILFGAYRGTVRDSGFH